MTRNPPSVRTILLVVLASFWLGQALAVAHASRHAGGDAPGLPGHHAQLCTDCATTLPLLAVAGGAGAALTVTRLAADVPRAVVDVVVPGRTPHPAFRSRAPPR